MGLNKLGQKNSKLTLAAIYDQLTNGEDSQN